MNMIKIVFTGFLLLSIAMLIKATGNQETEELGVIKDQKLVLTFPGFYKYNISSYNDSEFNCNDSVFVSSQEFKCKFYQDSSKILLLDSPKWISNYANHRPMMLFEQGKPIFSFWLVHPRSEYSCNWVVGIYNEKENCINLQLGYPKQKFKYQHLVDSLNLFTTCRDTVVGTPPPTPKLRK